MTKLIPLILIAAAAMFGAELTETKVVLHNNAGTQPHSYSCGEHCWTFGVESGPAFRYLYFRDHKLTWIIEPNEDLGTTVYDVKWVEYGDKAVEKYETLESAQKFVHDEHVRLNQTEAAATSWSGDFNSTLPDTFPITTKK